MGAAWVFRGQLGKPFANRYRRTEVKVGPAQPLPCDRAKFTSQADAPRLLGAIAGGATHAFLVPAVIAGLLNRGQQVIAAFSPLAFYSNTAVHILVDRAIGELPFVAAAETDGDAAQVAVQESLRPRDLLKFDFFVPGRAEFTAGPWRGVSNLTDRATIRRTLQELVSSGVLSSYRAGTEAIWGEEAQQHLVAERRTVLCTPWWMPISA